MAHQPPTAMAEVSINKDGKVYIGVDVRRDLGLDVDDRLNVTIPSDGGQDTEVTGYINGANQINAGRSLYEKFEQDKAESRWDRDTVRKFAFVTRLPRRWQDEHGPFAERGEMVDKLESST